MSHGPYAGQVAALATRHDKQRAIAPVFHSVLGMDVVVAEIDTDAFGTFAGEIPRIDTPLNTAIAKARAGMRATGLHLGLASEGTIGPDPLVPFATSDIEIIAFVDDDRGIVITEWTRSAQTIAFRGSVSASDDLSDLADLTGLMEKADFPRHGLMVRSGDGPDALIVKGITDETSLRAAIARCSAPHGVAIVESDFRASHSPTRMAAISACAQRLAERIATHCPECEGPGWGAVEPARGANCSACGTYVESAVRADRVGCPSCPAVQETPRPALEPRWCPLCNP